VYYRRRRDAGDSRAEALRRLQRRVVRSVFRCLRTDYANRPAAPQTIRSFPELERNNAEWSRALAPLGS
jgi:hypothetical protein